MANAKKDDVVVANSDFVKTNGLPRHVHEYHAGGPSLTRQEFAEECDINVLMARFDGALADPMRSVRLPVYYDFTEMPGSLMEAMQVMQTGQEAFMRLPATVRREFDNDPAAFVDFASDPANLDQMRTWGLAPPKPPEAAPIVGPVGQAPAAGGAPAPSPAVSGPIPQHTTST